MNDTVKLVILLLVLISPFVIGIIFTIRDERKQEYEKKQKKIKAEKIQKELSQFNFEKYFQKKQGNNILLFVYNNEEQGYRKINDDLVDDVKFILRNKK